MALIEEHGEELCKWESIDIGKPITQCRCAQNSSSARRNFPLPLQNSLAATAGHNPIDRRLLSSNCFSHWSFILGAAQTCLVTVARARRQDLGGVIGSWKYYAGWSSHEPRYYSSCDLHTHNILCKI